MAEIVEDLGLAGLQHLRNLYYGGELPPLAASQGGAVSWGRIPFPALIFSGVG